MNILSIVTTKDLTSGGPIYLCNSQKKFLQKKNYIKIISLNEISFYKFLLYFFGFKNKKINNVLLKFNLVHFHEVWNIRHHLLAFKLKKLSIPFIFSVHGHFDKWSVNNNYLIKKLFLYIFKKNFIHSSGLQISTHDELKEARIFLNEKNITFFLIPNGVEVNNDQSYLKKKEFDYNKIKLLFFGRIHYKKGINLILETLKELTDCNLNYSLTIVGPGDEVYIAKIRSLINSLNLNSYVSILEPVFGNMQKINIFNNHDIFLLPSFEEADSIALKEALAYGVPVVISKQCRLNDVEDYHCGVIIENNRSEDLTLAIKKISNKNLINIMSKNSVKLIHQKYTSDIMNENFLEIYFDVMSGTRLAKNWSCNNIL
jgi:glycosyltransferase involved in cell wall biosynthesis